MAAYNCGHPSLLPIMLCTGYTLPIIWAVLVVFAAVTVLLLYLGLFQDRSQGRP